MARVEDLPALLATESDRVEWKQSAGQRDGILQAVCALANDLSGSGASGHVVIGVDRRGQPVGVAGDLDEQQRELADRLRSSKIQPVPSTSLELVQTGGHSVLIVEVAPYPVPPVVEVDSVPWVRVGATTRRANDADLQRLQERRPERGVPFDTRPLESATLGDLETTALRSIWTAARDTDADPSTFPAFERWLVQRQIARERRGAFVPTAAAVLMYGRSPQDLLAGAWIDAVRYAGSDVDAPVTSRRRCTGTVTDQLEVAWAWISAQVETVPSGPEGIREGFVPTYPVEALKELTRNLVQHRLYEGTHAPGRIEWFEDRIELSNPGGPYGRASEGEFGANTDYRNPLVTAKLVEAGYVQQLGRGVRRVRLLLERNGNPPLGVETDGFTRLFVRRRP